MEVRVGNGKLIITGADLVHDLQKRPAARQLGNSLKEYALSDAFAPVINLRMDELEGYLK